MFKSKVLVLYVLVCYFLFAVFEFNGNENVAQYFNSLIVPLITILYVLFIKRKSKLFLMLLVCYSLADILELVISNITFDASLKLNDFGYYAGNSLYILSYLFLVVKISKSISFSHILKHFKLHLIVLSVLNVYILYVLHSIINPNLATQIDYYLELTYNIVIFLLLSIALLNYFYRDNKKSLYLFLGALGIVFAEVMDIAYIFIDQRCFLNFLATTLTLGAFYFFYQQSSLLNVTNEDLKYVTSE